MIFWHSLKFLKSPMPVLYLSLHFVHSRLGFEVSALMPLPCPPDVWVEVCGSNRLRVGLEAVEEFWQQRIRSLFCRFVPLTRQLGDGMSFGQVSESLWYEPGGTVAVSQQRIGSAHRLWKTRAFINAEKSFDHIFISAICLLLFISKLTFGRINTELQQKWAERGGKSDLKRDTSC